MDVVLKILALIAVPIALPAWLLEALYRRLSKKSWEFNIWSGTIYIFVLIGLSFLFLFSELVALQALGFYVFSALELVGVAMAGGIIMGNIGDYRRILYSVARRKGPIIAVKVSVRITWIALSSYFYSILYFSIATFLVHEFDEALYTGVQGFTKFERFFNFLYFSFVSMATFGFTEIAPASIFSKVLYMIEVSLGLLFMLFVFSAFANHLIETRFDKSPGRERPG